MDISISQRLKEIRKKNKITVKKASKDLLISRQSLLNYERGTTSPSAELLKGICAYYNVSPNYILFGSSERLNQLSNAISRKIFNFIDLLLEKDITYDQYNNVLKIENEQLEDAFIYCNSALKSKKLTKLEIIEGILKYINKIN